MIVRAGLLAFAMICSGVATPSVSAQDSPASEQLSFRSPMLPLPTLASTRTQQLSVWELKRNQFRVNRAEEHSRPRLGKKFWIPWTIGIALMFADAEMTAHCARTPSCQEWNPVLGPRPSRARIYGIKAPITALAFYFSQQWKRDKNGDTRGWWAMPTIIIATNGASVVANLSRSRVEQAATLSGPQSQLR